MRRCSVVKPVEIDVQSVDDIKALLFSAVPTPPGPPGPARPPDSPGPPGYSADNGLSTTFCRSRERLDLGGDRSKTQANKLYVRGARRALRR